MRNGFLCRTVKKYIPLYGSYWNRKCGYLINLPGRTFGKFWRRGGILLGDAVTSGETNESTVMVVEKKPRPAPLLGVAALTGLIVFMFWRLHLQKTDPPFTSDRAHPFEGAYRLLRSDNISMEPSPFPMDTLTADDWHQLIDIYDFTYVMNDASVLCNVTNAPLVLAVVHSKPSHFSHRKAIRETWGRDIDVVFMVGNTDNSTQQKLHDENTKYNDIVQGSFVDSYRNLTYKHVMGLKWVTYFCRTARYVLKLDDDVFVHSRNLHDLLMRQLSPLGARRLILCEFLPWSVAKRSYRSKWRVTPAEYPDRWYPGYCPGWAVLYSPDVVFALYREAQRTPYFWIDDVHVTGTLVLQTNLSHTSLGSRSYLWASDIDQNWGKHRTEFVVGLTNYYSFQKIWETLVS